MRWATLKPPDLVILDLGLPDMDGAEVLERLRAWSSVPLIVLSVRSNEAEKVRLLESGADDYVVKPFGMAELLARAHAAMRRHVRVSTGEPVVKVGPLAIDLAARIVTIDGARVMLTPKEYRLLQLLAQHAGNVVTHQFLLKEVWGSPHLHDTHYLRIFVRKLRQKIEVDPTQPQILLDRARGRISPGGAGRRQRSGELASSVAAGRRRRGGVGALPLPLAGEGWGGLGRLGGLGRVGEGWGGLGRVGEGWGGGTFARISLHAPTLSLPRKRGRGRWSRSSQVWQRRRGCGVPA